MSDQSRSNAADMLERADASPRAIVGFDGFVDTIAHAVDRRIPGVTGGYEPLSTIADFGGRITDAAGRSANIELRAREIRPGGNGPLMAGALARLGLRVTLIGAMGRADDPSSIDPVYRPVADLCERAISIAASARTDALEFADGKIMFNWPDAVDRVCWETIVERVGIEPLAEMARSAEVFATVNWTNLAGLPSIWRGWTEHVLPRLGGDAPAVFVDLTDPAKRGDGELAEALGLIARLGADVTLGLNIAEAGRLLGLAGGGPTTIERTPSGLEDAARRLADALGVALVLVHTREAAAGAGFDQSASVSTRLVERPAISTGAGDHFNGGFAAARALGLPLGESLACGCDTATRFVRTGRCPDRSGLIEELRSGVRS